ncbi:MAG: sporulation protein YqfD [Tissierellia bacterium]|nr:sporulation protein YqfD [Tissierellia bacterium]
MGIIKIWHYLKGYVIIKIEGLTLERFLNLAANKDIYLWDIKRIDYTVLEMKTNIEGFRALREIVKKLGHQVEIVDKIGLPFLFHKFKNRKMLGAGILIFLILVIFLSSILWEIEVFGNEIINSQAIMQVLERENIKLGMIKYKIDKDYIEGILLNEFEIFSFVSLKIKGTKLLIEVKEQLLIPEQINTSIPCNIVANKKGIIIKAIAKNGKALVRKGDTVEKGQILITGVLEREGAEETKYTLIHSEGEVLAYTRYSINIEEPIIKTLREETGEIVRYQEIKVGKKGFQFLKEEIPFTHYNEETKEIKFFNGKTNLPFKILVHEYREVELKEIKQNVDFLKDSTHIKGVLELNKEIPEKAKVQSKDVKYYMKDGVLSTYIVIEVIEDIGEKQIINFN